MKKRVLTVDESQNLLKKYLPTAKFILAQTLSDAKKMTKFPLVLKLVSDKAIHKTDVKGIRIVHSKSELEKEFKALQSVAKKKKLPLKGIHVQEFVEGTELIIGIKNDLTFGHVLLFGMGGIFVEVFKDVSFRVCPITIKDASDMINELKSKKILEGTRGQKALNIKLLKEILVKTSKIPNDHPEIEEMDINPFILNDKKGFVADARIVLN